MVWRHRGKKSPININGNIQRMGKEGTGRHFITAFAGRNGAEMCERLCVCAGGGGEREEDGMCVCVCGW